MGLLNNLVIKLACAGLLAALLSGCASSVPDITNIQKVAGDALTPSELKETIDDLTLEQKKHKETSTK